MTDQTTQIDPRLLEVLACPACDDRPPVTLVKNGIKCDHCGRVYPIRDGIPEMLVESAIEPAGVDNENSSAMG